MENDSNFKMDEIANRMLGWDIYGYYNDATINPTNHQ